MKAKMLSVLWASLACACACAEDWIYVQSENIISNSVWKLNVQVANEAQKQLRIGSALDAAAPADNASLGHAFTGIGSGVLDLSADVKDTFAEKWTITELGNYSLVSNTSGSNPITEFIFPKTLLRTADYAICYSNRAYPFTRVIMDVPEFSGKLPANYFRYATGKITEFKITAPKMTEISGTTFRYVNNGSVIDVTDWDLSGLATLGRYGIEIANGYNAVVCGAVKLPVVTRINEIAFGSGSTETMRIGDMEWGTDIRRSENKSLTLESGVLAFNTYLTNLVIGAYSKVVFSGTYDYIYGGNTFTDAKYKLKRIQFVGSPLENTRQFLDMMLKNKSAGVTSDGVRICASKDFGWTRKRLNFIAAPQGDEIAAAGEVRATLAADEELIGVYVTANNERKAWVVHKQSPWYRSTVEVSHFDSRFDDPETEEFQVSFDRAAINGRYEPGTVVTLSANASASGDASFISWEGLPYGVDASEATVSFEIPPESELKIKARYALNWFYDSAAGTIENSIWKLNVQPYGAGGNELRLGAGSTPAEPDANSLGYAFTDKGIGILDLSGIVKDSNGNEYKIRELGQYSLCGKKTVLWSQPSESPVTSLVFPRTITKLNHWVIGNSTRPYGFDSLIVDIPEYLGPLPEQLFRNIASINYFRLFAPNMTAFHSAGRMIGSVVNGTIDFTNWNLDKVTTVGEYGLRIRINTSVLNGYRGESVGHLRLPSITNLPTQAIGDSKLTKLDLGTKYGIKEAKTLTCGGIAVEKCPELKEITFGPYSNISISTTSGSESFKTISNIESVAFMGRPFAGVNDVIDQILANRGNELDATSPQIRASALIGWNACAFVSPVAPGEEDAAAAVRSTLGEKERIFGVYVTADGARKAWMIHVPGEYDPKGTLIIVK